MTFERNSADFQAIARLNQLSNERFYRIATLFKEYSYLGFDEKKVFLEGQEKNDSVLLEMIEKVETDFGKGYEEDKSKPVFGGYFITSVHLGRIIISDSYREYFEEQMDSE